MALSMTIYEDGIIYIGDKIKIHLHDIKKGMATVSITAPKDILVLRKELKDKIMGIKQEGKNERYSK